MQCLKVNFFMRESNSRQMYEDLKVKVQYVKT